MNDDIKRFIHQYVNLPDNLISIFDNLVTYTELNPNEIFTKQGEYPTDFFIIKSGIIRSFLINENGTETTRAFFSSNDVSGATAAMMLKIPSNANYQALTKVTGYKGNFFQFMDLTKKHHGFSILYIKILEYSFLKAEDLLLTISSLSSTERYLALKQRIPDINNLITQKHIASYLNITPVQLSRIKKKLLTK